MATFADMSDMTVEHKELVSFFGKLPEEALAELRGMMVESLLSRADAMPGGIVNAVLMEKALGFHAALMDLIKSIAHLLTDEEIDYITLYAQEQNASGEDDSEEDFPVEE